MPRFFKSILSLMGFIFYSDSSRIRELENENARLKSEIKEKLSLLISKNDEMIKLNNKIIDLECKNKSIITYINASMRTIESRLVLINTMNAEPAVEHTEESQRDD